MFTLLYFTQLNTVNHTFTHSFANQRTYVFTTAQSDSSIWNKSINIHMYLYKIFTCMHVCRHNTLFGD